MIIDDDDGCGERNGLSQKRECYGRDLNIKVT